LEWRGRGLFKGDKPEFSWKQIYWAFLQETTVRISGRQAEN
jgi:hypothetical protein